MKFTIVYRKKGADDFGVRQLNGQIIIIHCPCGVKIDIDARALQELLARSNISDYEFLTHKWIIKNHSQILKLFTYHWEWIILVILTIISIIISLCK